MSEHMLAEAIELIQRTAVNASGADFVYCEREPKHIYFQRDADGNLERRCAVSGPMRHRALSIAAFGELSKFEAALSKVVDDGTTDSDQKTFVGRGKLVTLLSADRRDRVVMDLQTSPAFSRLESLAGARPAFSQREFVNLLRIDLHETGEQAAGLAGMVRELKFNEQADGESSVQVGRESVRRDAYKSIDPRSGVLPAEITLTLNVYPEFDHPVDIRAAVDLDLAETKFRLIPLSGQTSRAMRETDEALVAVVKTFVTHPVYCGLEE